MQADVGKVRQCLLNLLSNAAKFTESGEITLSVIIEPSADGSGKAENDWLIFTITDTGIGIPLDQIDKLFNPFTQADSSTTRNYGGSGLGTTISKQLAELMGGTLGLESREGEGSTIRIELPLS